jgi:obg-like ATPase 1
MEKVLEGLAAQMKRALKDKKLQEENACMLKVKEGLEKGTFVKDGVWDGKEVEFLNDKHFLTAKPVVYLVNIGDIQYVKKQNAWLPKIQAYIKDHGGGAMIPYSAEFESQVVDAGKEDKKA